MTVTADSTAVDSYPTRHSREFALLRRPDPVVWGEAGDGPLDAKALADFDADGFLPVDELITAEEVATYREETERLGRDPGLAADDRVVIEPESDEVRSVFDVHKLSPTFGQLVRDPRVVGRARQLLGSDVYVHQSRVNYKPGFGGAGFYWHSDFETWHAEDGMPVPRAISISIALTPNYPYNGALLVMRGSHKTFVSCVGETPEDHYKASLREQEIGTPDQVSLETLAQQGGIAQFTGKAGSATIFECNCMHGSNGNITPFPRSNIFVVFNSVENTLVEPYAAPKRRPEHIASRDFTPVR